MLVFDEQLHQVLEPQNLEHPMVWWEMVRFPADERWSPPNHPFYHFNAILSIIKQPLWIPPFMETPTKMRWFRTSQRLSSVMGFRSSYPLVLAQNIHFQCWWLIKLPLLLIQSCKFPFQNLGLNFWTSLKNNIYIPWVLRQLDLLGQAIFLPRSRLGRGWIPVRHWGYSPFINWITHLQDLWTRVINH